MQKIREILVYMHFSYTSISPINSSSFFTFHYVIFYMGVSTPLHWASQYDPSRGSSSPPSQLLLLDRGTCPNDKDRNGQTPLGRL